MRQTSKNVTISLASPYFQMQFFRLCLSLKSRQSYVFLSKMEIQDRLVNLQKFVFYVKSKHELFHDFYLFQKLFQSLLTQNTKSVIQSHDYNIAVSRQDRSIVRIPRIPFIRFTMNKYNDWQSLSLSRSTIILDG